MLDFDGKGPKSSTFQDGFQCFILKNARLGYEDVHRCFFFLQVFV